MPNLALPLSEQIEIVTFILRETEAIRNAIARTEQEIALMQEYRTRLTADAADVVTGRLDVRQAAATLSDLVETPADSAVVGHGRQCGTSRPGMISL